MLDAVAPLPRHALERVLVLVPELHGDAVAAVVGEEFLAEAVGALAGPFVGEEGFDGGVAGEEGGAVAPGGGGGVGGGDEGGGAGVPEGLGGFYFLVGGG